MGRKSQSKVKGGAVAVVEPARSLTLQEMFDSVLARVYAIPRDEQTPEMSQLLSDVFERLDEVSGIGRFRGMRPPRNATAVIHALKTRIVLTLGPQIQRSQRAVVEESHREVVIRHVDAGSPEQGKPN